MKCDDNCNTCENKCWSCSNTKCRCADCINLVGEWECDEYGKKCSEVLECSEWDI